MRGLIVATVLLVGCSVPDLDREPWVELGTGEVEFIPVSEGDHVDLVHGLQGGDHIWGSARVTGIDWREITLEFELLDEDDEQVTEPSLLVTALQQCPRSDDGCEAGMGETVGFPVIVDPPSAVFGGDITMKVTAFDEDGRLATDEVGVKPGRPLE